MNVRYILPAMLLFVCAMPVFGQSAGASSAQETSSEEQKRQHAEAEAVRKEVEEAAQTIGDYSIARRDEALRRSKDALDRADRRMSRLREDWNQRVERMSATARARNDATMADLKRRRDDLDARYERMRRESEQAWNEAKSEFVLGYRELAEAMREARADYERTREPAKNAPEEPEEHE